MVTMSITVHNNERLVNDCHLLGRFMQSGINGYRMEPSTPAPLAASLCSGCGVLRGNECIACVMNP